MAAKKKRGLGRGLDVLLGSVVKADTTDLVNSDRSSIDGHLTEIPVELIQRGIYQPRRDMDPDALEELAASIKVQGVIQPIVIRSISNDRYEIIAGERRWRATQMAGFDTIPVLIRNVSDEAAIAMSLIENIQREDLNPIEEAYSLQRLQQEFELTQRELAEAVGKSRPTVANLLRLMSLREDVRKLVEHGDLEMGHARAILGLSQDRQAQAANAVVAKGLSVRQTEALVRNMVATQSKPAGSVQAVDPDISHLEKQLSDKLGADVAIQHSAKGKGKLVLKYNSLDELDGILSHIN
jgi:ParB family chromosome partitioning protein